MREQRRLAAILYADVAGYSRLMGRDESGTLAALKTVRRALVDPMIAAHGGRIVKSMGDGLLTEFASVVDAMRCAVELQSAMAVEAGSMQFRIGVHMGDVIVDGEDIIGDGVNIAARLQGIAEPGGICVSQPVHDSIRNKLEVALDDAGAQALKNIAEPVRTWRWHPRGATDPAGALPAVPDQPSIAVLPFTNMSGDPEQDYFADGMVEDIITALSRFRYLFVIARNSSFTYKGRAVDVKQVGRELGVRYVLEGSVRKAGGRVRITGQLIEASSGAHIWAERIDGALEDVFALQDQVAVSVAAAVAPLLRKAEIERAHRKPTASLQAYDFFLQALAKMHGTDRASMTEGLRLADAAIALDPGYAMALAVKARMLFRRMVQRHVQPGDPCVAEGVVLARRAAALAPEDADVLWLAAFVIALGDGDFASGFDLVDRSLLLNPNAADALVTSGLLRAYRGDAVGSLPHLERAARLNPVARDRYIIHQSHAMLHFAAGDDQQALASAEAAVRALPGHLPSRAFTIAALGRLGRIEQGRAAVAALLEIAPQETLRAQRGQFGRLLEPGVLDGFLDGLRRAGLPD
jgi:TolB-like protein/class 3 adenylate cyclase